MSFNQLTIYKTMQKVEEIMKTRVNNLSDIFDDNPRLIISPNDFCRGHCLHCVANSSPSGITMPYNDFKNINPEFFKLFSVVDFGRRGNPLHYNYEGKDLADLIKFLNEQGITNFTLALTIQKDYIPLIGTLETLTSKYDINIGTMVTYHHYYENFNDLKFAEEFNKTLKHYLKFSNKIKVSLLGDSYLLNGQTKEDETNKTFQKNWNIIFKDIELIHLDENEYIANYSDIQSQITIPPVNNRVYPLGRFKNHLSQKGMLHEYEYFFEELMNEYVCPDLIKWPGIIIEPDGNLNLCASFEAVDSPVIVSNIFNKSFTNVKKDLMDFHQKELFWFIQNLPDILKGKIPTCKLKNHCYTEP